MATAMPPKHNNNSFTYGVVRTAFVIARGAGLTWMLLVLSCKREACVLLILFFDGSP